MISQAYLDFAAARKLLVRDDKRAWFNCASQFDSNGKTAFEWNEFEKISLDAATEDKAWQLSIRNFWNNHVPIYMSVENGYEFHAWRQTSSCIVHGSEPEFEEVEVVSNSINEYVQEIIKGNIKV